METESILRLAEKAGKVYICIEILLIFDSI
jgi:hypothetical protein